MVHIFFLQFQQQRMILILLPRANMSFVIYCFGQESCKHLGWKTLQLCSSPSQMFAGIQVTLLVAATYFRREVQQNVSKIMLTQCSQSFRFVNPFFFQSFLFSIIFFIDIPQLFVFYNRRFICRGWTVHTRLQHVSVICHLHIHTYLLHFYEQCSNAKRNFQVGILLYAIYFQKQPPEAQCALPPPPRRVEPQNKFSERGGLTRPQLLEGGYWKRGE